MLLCNVKTHEHSLMCQAKVQPKVVKGIFFKKLDLMSCIFVCWSKVSPQRIFTKRQ